jgi:hypothetical protein
MGDTTAQIAALFCCSFLGALSALHILKFTAVEKQSPRNDDSISLNDLVALVRSHKLHLKEHANNVILDRAMSALPFIIQACKDGRDPNVQLQALSCIRSLSSKRFSI